MTRSRERGMIAAAVAAPLLLGVWYFRSSTTPTAPSSVAQKTKAPSPRLTSLDSPEGARKIEAHLAQEPNDAAAHRELGFYYRYKSRDLARSVRHWREAVRLEPGDSTSKWELGLTLLRAKRHDEAVRVFEEMASAKIEGTGPARKVAEQNAANARRFAEMTRREGAEERARRPKPAK